MRDFSYEIVPATPRDFLPVAALDRIAWPVAPDTFIPDGEHVWRVWCERATVLIARLNAARLPETENVAGVLLMFPTIGTECFLHKIMVHPDCRGQGIGSALMRAGLARATMPTLLTVDPANAPAVGLYQKLGFVIRDRVAGYYRPHEDRYLMQFTPSRERVADAP